MKDLIRESWFFPIISLCHFNKHLARKKVLKLVSFFFFLNREQKSICGFSWSHHQNIFLSFSLLLQHYMLKYIRGRKITGEKKQLIKKILEVIFRATKDSRLGLQGGKYDWKESKSQKQPQSTAPATTGQSSHRGGLRAATPSHLAKVIRCELHR